MHSNKTLTPNLIMVGYISLIFAGSFLMENGIENLKKWGKNENFKEVYYIRKKKKRTRKRTCNGQGPWTSHFLFV